MKRYLKPAALAVLVFCSFALSAQDKDSVTTIILVRHAEKADDGSSDPDLSTIGQDRAFRLAQLLKQSNVTAIYSTPFRRTRNTATPLANMKELPVQTYDPRDGGFLRKLIQQHPGGTIVVVGHSNTVPGMANMLLGKRVVKDFDDGDYGNLLVITTSSSVQAKLLHLTF